MEIGGQRAEDGSWMRKKEDYNHINVAELEAFMKGVNLGIKWGLKKMLLVTDSATVYGWVRLMISEERAVKTKGAAEMLVKRRLGMLKSLIEELDLKLEVKLVASGQNKADSLTRVKARWLELAKGQEEAVSGASAAVAVKDCHDSL